MNEVRRLTIEDLERYRALHRYGLVESSESFIETVEEDAKRPDAEVASTLRRGEIWGVVRRGELLAKLTLQQPCSAVLSHTRWLRAFYVAPGERGTGLASKLVQGAIDDAQSNGAALILLWVSAENAPAAWFYRKLGFRECGRAPGGLLLNGRGVDDVLMCLET